MSRSLCFNTLTDQVCLNIIPLGEGDVLSSQGFMNLLGNIGATLGFTTGQNAELQRAINEIAPLGEQCLTLIQNISSTHPNVAATARVAYQNAQQALDAAIRSGNPDTIRNVRTLFRDSCINFIQQNVR